MTQTRTYQTRLRLSAAEDAALSAYAKLFGRVERTFFARIQAGDTINATKRTFLRRFGISARQFNAVHVTVKGAVASLRECRNLNIQTLERRIRKAKIVAGKCTLGSAKLHQKKRRLVALEARLARLGRDDRIHLCFGGRKRLRQDPAAWKFARSNHFFVLGSKDETGGCQGCVATLADDDSIMLRLRLPDAVTGIGKYLSLPGLRFTYGQEQIAAAIGRSFDKSTRRAISYRFVRDAKSWRVFASLEVPEPVRVSIRYAGMVGVDLNADHLALTETDRQGNPIGLQTIPLVTYGKTANQSKALIGEAVKQVVARAVLARKPIVVEKLEFAAKKATLEASGRRYARMLSSLTYSRIKAVLYARAYDAGIEVRCVNPAYTSQIGKHKFARRYGMSPHHGAALAIARRASRYGERLPSRLYGTLPESVRKRARHVWSLWAAVIREQRRMQRTRSRLRQERSGPVEARAETKTSCCRRNSGTRVARTVRATAAKAVG